MIEAKCHCGNVTLTVAGLPATLTSCNCSICHRLGALWAYYQPDEVVVAFRDRPTAVYLWGDRDIEFHHCAGCGCATHYTSADKSYSRLALNARMLEPRIVEAIPVRYFDGAVSWKYIDQ